MKLLITAPIYLSKQAHLDFIKETLDSIETSHDYGILLVENYVADEFKEKFKKLIKPKKIDYMKNQDGNNVAAGWNIGITYGIENNFDYILIINLDIIFHESCIDKLIDFAQRRPEALVWTAQEWSDRATFNDLKFEPYPKEGKKFLIKANGQKHIWDKMDEHPHFSCFMLNNRTVHMLKKHEESLAEPEPGYFDDHFKRAYFEDQDYHQRILMAGFDAIRCNEALFYHYGSRTIKSDEQLEMENVHSYEGNRKYFKDKWGYDSHGMVPTNMERIKLAYLYPFNKAPENNNL